MSLSAKLRRGPMRVVTGAFIVNSGVGKLGADEETAKQLHGMAKGSYGVVGNIDPKLFAKGVAAGEIVIGGLVLAPMVSPVIAGAALVGFSGALLNMYRQTPGLTEDGIRPTPQGAGVAKDVWMLGIGASLIADGLFEPAHDKKVELVSTAAGKRKGKQSRKERKEAKQARAETRAHLAEMAKDTQKQLGKRARKAKKQVEKSDALEQARALTGKAAERAAGAREEYAPVVAEKAKHAVESARGLRDQYAPVVADKAKHAVESARDLRDQYAPVVADRAKTAVDSAKDLRHQYAPVVADRAKQARSAAQDLAGEYGPIAAERAKQARSAAQDLAGEYGPIAAERARQAADRARDAAQIAADRAQLAADKARALR